MKLLSNGKLKRSAVLLYGDPSIVDQPKTPNRQGVGKDVGLEVGLAGNEKTA